MRNIREKIGYIKYIRFKDNLSINKQEPNLLKKSN